MNKNRLRKYGPTYIHRRLRRGKDWVRVWLQSPSFERLNPEE